MKNIKYFYGICLWQQDNITEQIQDITQTLINLLPCPVRAVSKTKYHVTLVYLGVIDPNLLVTANQYLQNEKNSLYAIDLHINELCLFQRNNAIIIALKVGSNNNSLSLLYESILSCLQKISFRPDLNYQLFQPHITIAKCDSKYIEVIDALDFTLKQQYCFKVKNISLIYLDPKTQEYKSLLDIPLKS